MKSIMLRCYPDTPPERIEILPWGCPPLWLPTETSPERSGNCEAAVDTPRDRPAAAQSSAIPMPAKPQGASCIAGESAAPACSTAASEPSDLPRKLPQEAPELMLSTDTQGTGAAALRAKYGIEPDAHVLLCLSRISPEKGQDFLLKTLIEWEGSPSYPSQPVWLFICGAAAFMNGPGYERRLRNLAARLKKIRVVFPGYVTGSRKLSFFTLAQVYLFPSSHESYGLTLIEALNSGLPAICRDHAGARQILSPEFGIIVPGFGRTARLAFRSAIERILLDDSLRASMSRSASEWARRRPFSQSAARLADLLENLGEF